MSQTQSKVSTPKAWERMRNMSMNPNRTPRFPFVLTRKQRLALKRVFDRKPIYPYVSPEEREQGVGAIPLTYRQFRRGVIYDRDYVGIVWCGMFVGIEKDGYTHT
jgi:hypothetical protein